MINLKTNDWKIENIDTVLFDKDGTLVDLHFFWGKMTELRVQEIIKRYNLNSDCHFELCNFLGFDVNSKKMLPNGITALYSRPKIIELFIEELKKYSLDLTSDVLQDIFDYVSELFYENLEEHVKPINEAIEFAKKLKQKGVKLGIVTADSVISTNRTLKYLNLEGLFDVIVARESHIDRKETGKPTIFALEKLNSSPKNAIMIGDTPIDFISASKAGINKTILVATGQMTMNELACHSNYCVSSLNVINF